MPTHEQSSSPPDELEDLPASAKLVYKTLKHEGELTHGELMEETRLAGRTIRYALNQLKDNDLVTSQPCISDTRKNTYSIQTE